MWYFLRALWERDGLTQRELSDCAGTKEPTTLLALRSMERRGLIKRVASRHDRRKSHIHLTAAARALKSKLLPEAKLVNTTATEGFDDAEIQLVIQLLTRMRKNLAPPSTSAATLKNGRLNAARSRNAE
jgi:DNA-binding MarR family transcriptional regulator